jgi:hypothetical protein
MVADSANWGVVQSVVSGKMGHVSNDKQENMLRLREALEASWKPDTAYLGVYEKNNPALGQCYPSTRVVQYFYPHAEIAKGEVWTSKGVEKHFWNVFHQNGIVYHVDFTWQQFPHGSVVNNFTVLERQKLDDSSETVKRVSLLLQRVNKYLST